MALWAGVHQGMLPSCRVMHCGSKNIMILVFDVTLQDHVIKGPFDFMGRSQSREVTILSSLVVIGFVVVEK